MFRLSLFLAVVAAAVAAALMLVGEAGRGDSRLGYRVADLEQERVRLLDQNRRLEAEVARRKAPVQLYERAKQLDVRAEPPEERFKKEHAPPPKKR